MNRPEQLERLLTERTDGTLTTEESAEVQRSIAGDARAAEAARQYERLHRLLADWRTLPADVDWGAFRQTASTCVAAEAVGARKDSRTSDGRSAATRRGAANVEGEAAGARKDSRTSDSRTSDSRTSDSRTSDDESDDVDRLVRRAAGDVPEVDWAALKSRISAAVQYEAAQTRRETMEARREARGVPARWRRAMTWTGRVGLPLAAAAAIALLVWLPQTGEHGGRGGLGAGGSKSPIVLVSLETPQSGGQVSVSFEGVGGSGAGRAEVGFKFDETMAPAAQRSPVSGTAIVVRSSVGGAGGAAAESFDDSPLY